MADWCPTCKERTALHERGVCAWCDTALIAKRGGWKRPDRSGRLTDDQLRGLHIVYRREGLSINELGKRTKDALGYSSHFSAAYAISTGWERLGLPRRDRIEQVKRTCTIHGMAPKHGPRPGYGTYKRRRKQADQPRCRGVKRQPPQKGRRCKRPALFGSEFCQAHEPSRELQRQATTARMRRRQPKLETVAFEPFAAWVEGLLRELGTLADVAEVLGRSTSTVHNFVHRETTSPRRRRTSIGRPTVEGYLSRVAGVSFDALYAAEKAEAA